MVVETFVYPSHSSLEIIMIKIRGGSNFSHRWHIPHERLHDNYKLFWSEQSMCAALRRCRQNVVATIFGIIFLSFFLDTYFSSRRG